MATAKKRGDSWRCLVYDGKDAAGKRQYKSFTARTKKEAEFLASDFVLNRKQATSGKMTVKQAIEQFISNRSNVLSPSTIRGYKQMNTYYAGIDNIMLTRLDSETVQRWVNDFSANHSPKTVKNAYGLLSSTLKQYAPSLNLKINLPQKQVLKYTIPSNAEICLLTDFFALHDKDMLNAVYLASFGGFRRSEICSLTSKDVNGNIIHIHSAVVIDSDKNLVKKSPKTATSDRYVTLPQFVIDSLPRRGKLVDLTPTDITRRFGRAVRKLNLPLFRFHDLRHYSASIAHAIGVPDQFICERHGWKNDTILKEVYRNTTPDFEQQFTDKINDYFSKMQPPMQPASNKKG